MRTSLLLSLFIFILIFCTSKSQSFNNTYTTCSSTPDLCLSCLNAYQCNICATNNLFSCCPLFCKICSDMNTCLQCQPFFILSQISSGVMCTRIKSDTDPNFSQNNGQCNPGFYLQPVTVSCLNCSQPNCLTCTYQNCTFCNNAYYLAIIVNQTQCLPCVPNCLQCNASLSCNQCNYGYYFNLISCVPCSQQNCLTCNSPTNCTSCTYSAFLYNNSNSFQCINCSTSINNCQYCNLTQVNNLSTIVCSYCSNGYYLNSLNTSSNNRCLPCITNCSTCSNSTSCNRCNENFVVNTFTNQCVPCSFGCANCVFNVSLNASFCQLCDAQFYMFQNNTLECQPCQLPCTGCINSTTNCLLCSPIYFFVKKISNSKNQCLFCNISGCISCNSQFVCTLCENGFYLQYSSSQSQTLCQPCSENCLLCSNSILCEECQSGYFLNTGTQNCLACTDQDFVYCNITVKGSSVQCKSGYLAYQNSDTTYKCLSCTVNNCSVCSWTNNQTQNVQNCTTCIPQYYLVNNSTLSTQSCLPCFVNCNMCLNSITCIECNQKYFLNISSNGTQSCIACDQQCKYCNINGCLQCDQGYYTSPTTIRFQITDQNIPCFPCTITGCVNCFNHQYCYQCNQIGYAPIPTIYGNCTACPQGCTQCDNSLACFNCMDGYLLNTQLNTCLDQTVFPIWGYFVCITFSLCIIYVVLEKVYRKCKKSHQRKQQKQSLSEVLTENHTTELKTVNLQ